MAKRDSWLDSAACDPACASFGDPAAYVITSTVVFAGTVTVTLAVNWSGGVPTLSSFCAAVAMSVDRTSCASVSRLIVPLVRPPAALAPRTPVGATSTEVADSYTFGWARATAPAPRTPATASSSTTHQCLRSIPRWSARSYETGRVASIAFRSPLSR